MVSHEILGRLRDSLLDLDKRAVLEAASAVVDGCEGVSAEDAVDALADALRTVGTLFQKGEWFVSELVYSGEIAEMAMALLTPSLRAGAGASLGTVVVGTVAGDLHDLGKNIFCSYATSAGFEVIDLGTDVSSQSFARAAEEHRPLALGVSCLLTISAGAIGKVIEELESRGLRQGLKVIIGGAAITEDFAREIGADAFAPDAVTGTDKIREWSGS
jgi:methylmalonyl-CoA mutase cobalamin-binding domain/chain